MLRYAITNRNGSTVKLNLLNEACWLKMELATSDGRVLPSLCRVAPARAGHLPRTCTNPAPVLWPGATHRDGIVLDQRFSNLVPGDYRLSLDVTVPYSAGGRPVAGTTEMRRVLSFTVRPVDPDRLRHTARALLVRSIRCEGRERGMAVEALLAMPAPTSRATWCALVCEGPEEAVRHAVDEEVRRNGGEGADLLARVAWDARRPADLRARARAGLLNLWWNGGDDVRSRVAMVFARHEGRFPETTSPPVLM